MTTKVFEACQKDLQRSEPFFKSLKLSELWNANGNIELTDVPLKEFFDGIDQRNFWSYMGSLTQPPCTEGVHWNVLEMVMPVSYDQYNEVRSHFEMDRSFAGGKGNNRKTQPLNKRKLFYNSNAIQTLSASIGFITLATLF